MRFIVCMKPNEAQDVARMLRQRLVELCADAEVEILSTGAALIESARDGEGAFALVDTALADMPGLDAMRAIRAQGSKCRVAFLADSSAHALACYEVHPSGFFIKPLQYGALCAMLEWDRAALSGCMRYIEVLSARASLKLALWDISFIEVLGRTCLIHTGAGVVPTNCPLSAMLAKLKAEPFFRCHRSYIVNLNRIERLNPSGAVTPLGEVPVSADRRAALTSRLLKRCPQTGAPSGLGAAPKAAETARKDA